MFLLSFFDNINSIIFSDNLVYHVGIKQIEVHYHFIRGKVLAKKINLIHVSIINHVADIFTKSF
jgi:hypothetical protein